jgi:hypothetical protein
MPAVGVIRIIARSLRILARLVAVALARDHEVTGSSLAR